MNLSLASPLFEPFARRRSDAVQVQRDESQHRIFQMSPRGLVDARNDVLAQAFVSFALDAGVLRFGEFRTKAGRLSPYFFNAGLFDDGAKLGRLAEFYARRLLAARTCGALDFDMLFGPAYKGIVLAAAVAIELARQGTSVPYAYNRKEAKDHGEGGTLVGAPIRGRVLIVDDVISAGTSVRESVELIRAAGGTPSGVVIALDRQERATDEGPRLSAVQAVQEQLGLPVVAVATLADLMSLLEHTDSPALHAHTGAVSAYRERYGV
jgi:orotate phosphoribosyltransferase